VCRRDMKQVQAASEELCRVYPGQIARACEDLLEVKRHGHQSLGPNVLSKLIENRATLLSRYGAAPHEHFEGVRDLQLMQRRERNLRGRLHRSSGCAGKMFCHINRYQRARIDVRRHRSPRPSITISAALGEITRSPNTDLARALRSGHGLGVPVGCTGVRRATGRCRRVTSITWPRSTRAITRFRFCCSSRTDTVLFAMSNILYYKNNRIKSACTSCEPAPDRARRG
jgi:hypothetical protein